MLRTNRPILAPKSRSIPNPPLDRDGPGSDAVQLAMISSNSLAWPANEIPALRLAKFRC